MVKTIKAISTIFCFIVSQFDEFINLSLKFINTIYRNLTWEINKIPKVYSRTQLVYFLHCRTQNK